MWLLLLTLAAHADCPMDVAALTASLDAAEIAFLKLDAAAFTRASSAALAGAECLATPPTPALAARLHRVRALSDFVNRDEAGATRAYAAARAISDEWPYADSQMPANHPLRQLFEDADTLSPSSTQVTAPAEGRLELDGVVATSRPDMWPTVAVLVGADGKVKASAYLDPGEPLFPYATAPAVTAPPVVSAPPRERRLGMPLAIAAGASLAASGGLALAAAGVGDDYWDPEGDYTQDELTGMQRRHNAMVVGAYGAAAVGVGAGVGAVLVGSW